MPINCFITSSNWGERSCCGAVTESLPFEGCSLAKDGSGRAAEPHRHPNNNNNNSNNSDNNSIQPKIPQQRVAGLTCAGARLREGGWSAQWGNWGTREVAPRTGQRVGMQHLASHRGPGRALKDSAQVGAPTEGRLCTRGCAQGEEWAPMVGPMGKGLCTGGCTRKGRTAHPRQHPSIPGRDPGSDRAWGQPHAQGAQSTQHHPGPRRWFGVARGIPGARRTPNSPGNSLSGLRPPGFTGTQGCPPPSRVPRARPRPGAVWQAARGCGWARSPRRMLQKDLLYCSSRWLQPSAQ